MEIDQYFSELHRGFERLAGDIAKMQKDALKKKEDPDAEESTLTSLQRVTTLRKDASEVKDANENPNLAFIYDKVEDLLSK